MDELISRQAAIDAHCELCGDRDKCNGDICPDVEVFKLLPSAQPEIIYCKDCEYYKKVTGLGVMACHYLIGDNVIKKEDDFCSRAERREE